MTGDVLRPGCTRGEWAGTMCLTEPQAGSDVGASKTRAVKQPERQLPHPAARRSSSPAGEHDLTENIVHAVLARTPGAPEGTSGLSLFIVPKVRVNPDGSLGEPNDVVCSNIEEKMGIHGSPTCSLVFGGNDGCRGLPARRGAPGHEADVPHDERRRGSRSACRVRPPPAAAYLAALDYAKTRLQGRHWTQVQGPRGAAGADRRAPGRAPHAVHLQAAYVQAMRALLLQTSYYIDMTPRHRRARSRSATSPTSRC